MAGVHTDSPKTSYSVRTARSRSPVRARGNGMHSNLRRVESEDEIQRLRELLKQYQEKEKNDDDNASVDSGKGGKLPSARMLSRGTSRDQSFAEWAGHVVGTVTHAVVKKSTRALGLKMKATSAEAIYNKRLHLVGTMGIVCALYGALFFSIGPDAMFIGANGKGWALFLIWVSSTLGGAIMAKLGLPSLLGMLGSGIVLTNAVPGGLVYMLPESWAAAIRAFGLCVILMRSGERLTWARYEKGVRMGTKFHSTHPAMLMRALRSGDGRDSYQKNRRDELSEI